MTSVAVWVLLGPVPMMRAFGNRAKKVRRLRGDWLLMVDMW